MAVTRSDDQRRRGVRLTVGLLVLAAIGVYVAFLLSGGFGA